MKRQEQHSFNRQAIQRVVKIETGRWCRAPRYRMAVDLLNREGYTSSRGKQWTLRSLYRMLQREGYRGLYGLFDFKKRGIIWGHYANRVIETKPEGLERAFPDILVDASTSPLSG